MVKWKNYSRRFTLEARRSGHSKEAISNFLEYAKNLNEKGLPIIFNLDHFSRLVGYKKEYINRCIENTTRFYRHFEIPKKNGGRRKISEPLPSLKEIQSWILENILYKCTPSKFAKAYIPSHSIKSNAILHRRQKTVLTIDIKDFFPSIKVDKVKILFSELGFSEELSDIFSSLCCLDDSLPQGAPTSPMISNLVIIGIDQAIWNYVSFFKIRYTRYADDLTFSGDFSTGTVINRVREILLDGGFTLNNEKIRAQGVNNRQLVTGVVVNEKMQVSRTIRMKLRQEIYYISKYGLVNHMKRINLNRANYLGHLIGLASYILFINPRDKKAKDQLLFLKEQKLQLRQKL